LDVRFTLDGKRVLSCDARSEVRVWDVADGKEQKLLRLTGALPRHLSVSRDGKRVLVVTSHQLVVWDLEQDRAVKRVQPPGAGFSCGCLCGEDRFALTAVSAGRAGPGKRAYDVVLYDLETGQEVRRFQGHTSLVRAVLASPDGRRGYSSCLDRTLRIW